MEPKETILKDFERACVAASSKVADGTVPPEFLGPLLLASSATSILCVLVDIRDALLEGNKA